jgi:hypothetical protein
MPTGPVRPTQAPKRLPKKYGTAREAHMFEYIPLGARQRFHKDCVVCITHIEDYGPHCMMPAHEPSRNCESGRRPHCTCAVCF